MELELNATEMLCPRHGHPYGMRDLPNVSYHLTVALAKDRRFQVVVDAGLPEDQIRTYISPVCCFLGDKFAAKLVHHLLHVGN